MSFSFSFKDIPENGSFAGRTIDLPTPNDKPCKIDTLPKDKIKWCEFHDYLDYFKDIKCDYTQKRPTPSHDKMKNGSEDSSLV